MPNLKIQNLFARLSSFILGMVLMNHSIAAEEDCTNLYEHSQYSGQVFSLCETDAGSQEFYGNQHFADDSITSIQLAPDQALEACDEPDGNGVCRTYYSSATNVGEELDDSFSYARLIPFNYRDFYMAFMSDPQYPWSCKTPEENCDDRDKAWQENINHVQSLNALKSNLGKEQFAGVVINGDLTAFGHDWQFNAYYELYHKQLKMNVYPGLGNHDISNNVNDCFVNNCASRMILYLKDHVQTLNVRSFDYHSTGTYYEFPSLKKKYSKSFAYSWDIGDIHFVQLNNYPTYTAQWDGWNFGKARRDYFTIQSAREWLTKDLEQASKEGKHIILNYHISGFTDGIKDILRRYKVSAIFAGHLHSYVGQVNFHTLWNFYGPGKHLPVFLGGAAVFQKYMLVRFKEDHFDVSIVKSDQGASYELIDKGTYPLY
ncbi:metallophosphoesterase [Endozoicomonas atrinae]|uniref:metallophosphoesterase n=1 Tax=Endozoicomonas atrinae TaxID=1333660 RepID=UPI000826CD9E|nr:metallophosphoesterase [Endozoicomonas atrinae]